MPQTASGPTARLEPELQTLPASETQAANHKHKYIVRSPNSKSETQTLLLETWVPRLKSKYCITNPRSWSEKQEEPIRNLLPNSKLWLESQASCPGMQDTGADRRFHFSPEHADLLVNFLRNRNVIVLFQFCCAHSNVPGVHFKKLESP